MKRFALFALIALAFAVGIAATTPNAQAGLFGAKKSATPSPSPSPSALPTASPEPPSIAIPRLIAKLKANPTDQLAMAQLAAQYLQVNRPDITLQYTQHLLQMGDKTAQVYYYDGIAQMQLNNPAGATYDLEQASNLDPTNLGILAQLADVYLRTNRPNDAERVARRAVTFNKADPEAIMTLGGVYASEQHFDDARAQFEAAFALNPKDTAPLFQIATTYAQQDNIPMALQTIQRALAVDPRSIQALVFKADLYARQHDDARTVEAYDDAVVAAPTDDQKVAIMIRKAGYFVQEKKDSQALPIFQQMVTQFPKVSAGLVAYGDYLASQKPGSRPKPDAAEFKLAEQETNDRIQKLLSIHGKKTVTDFHKELGKILWTYCGMARTEKSLKEALTLIPALREEFWKNVNVPGDGADLNQSLERAGRVADYLELAELLVYDALMRDLF